jgi:hypothetical protein
MGTILSAHTALNLLMYMSSIGLFISGLFGSSENVALDRQKWVSGLILWLVYPIVTETLMNIKAKFFVKKTNKSDHRCLECDQQDEDLKKILPIVYHPKYNITFGGLEKVHPFDS